MVADKNDKSNLAPCVRVFSEDGIDSGIAFHGVPGGHEFTSFVLGLYNAAGPGQTIDEDTLKEVEEIQKRTDMKILVSLSCTMCPDLVIACQRIATKNKNIKAEVYDLQHFEELKKKYNVMIGERTAEDLKINIGCVYPKIQDMEMDIRGRDLVTGLPKTITVHSSEMLEALLETAMLVVDAVHSVLERTPPELAADISDRGIYMTGGGCLIDGLDKLLQEKTGINVMIAQDAISCVALGTGKALDNLDVLDNKKRR